jgi:hypothetical protein
VVASRPGEKDVQAHLKKLQDDWNKDRGEEHTEVRKFIYDLWPDKMETAELRINLTKARAAFDLCKKLGDRLTPRRMLQANLAHGVSLKNRLEVLKRAPASEDNRTEITTIGRLAGELRDLHNDVRAWVEGKK